MDKPTFVYTTYIRTTPERLWQGLTDPAFTQRYWGIAFETDWKPGSTDDLESQTGRARSPTRDQVVLESEPYRRLSYTWHTFTPEWAAAYDSATSTWRESPASAVPRSPLISSRSGSMVKLTVIHDDFEPGSVVLAGITEGWPRILADLKTLLETGDLLPAR